MIRNRRLTGEETHLLLAHLRKTDEDIGLNWINRSGLIFSSIKGRAENYEFFADLIGARYILKLRGDKEMLKNYAR